MAQGGKPLSERAKARLKAAVRLLRGSPESFGLPKSWKLDDSRGYFEGIQSCINDLDPERREHLKGLVDWVEEFEGAADPAGPSRP